MTNIFHAKKSSLLSSIIGGCGEIGLNMTLYHYNGKTIMVDAGIGFSDQVILPGTDIMIPDISFITENKITIDAIIITHGHEDHIGAIPYLYEQLGSPVIYSTPLTTNMISSKMISKGMEFESRALPLNNEPLDICGFTVRTYNLHHSIPEMRALLISTPTTNVLHSGDWNIDHYPIIAKDEIPQLSQQSKLTPIHAMLCDSTNITIDDETQSEEELRTSIIDTINQQPHAVIAAMFSSNIARIETFYQAAKASGRTLVISGSSLHRIIVNAKKSGYLQDVEYFDAKDMIKIDRSKMLLLATGCQGEPNAALIKMCRNEHSYYNISQGDTLIFSSRAIPSNINRITYLEELALMAGANVLNSHNSFVHVSGHASKSSLNYMYSQLKPKCVVPVHGDLFRLKEHQKLADSHPDIDCSTIIKDGNIIEITPDSVKVIDVFETGYHGIDGNKILRQDSPVVKQRRKMLHNGIISCHAAISAKKKNLVLQPTISHYGILDEIHDIDYINDIVKLIADSTKNILILQKNDSAQEICNMLTKTYKSLIKKYCHKELQKYPVIDILIQLV